MAGFIISGILRNSPSFFALAHLRGAPRGNSNDADVVDRMVEDVVVEVAEVVEQEEPLVRRKTDEESDTDDDHRLDDVDEGFPRLWRHRFRVAGVWTS